MYDIYATDKEDTENRNSSCWNTVVKTIGILTIPNNLLMAELLYHVKSEHAVFFKANNESTI